MAAAKPEKAALQTETCTAQVFACLKERILYSYVIRDG